MNRQKRLGLGSGVVLGLLMAYCGIASWRGAEVYAAEANAHGLSAVHVLGLANLKPGAKGQILLEGAELRFTSAGGSSAIPAREIQSVSVEKDTAPLIKGTTGTVVHMAPYGAGRVLGTIRSDVDTLTVTFREADGGLHGAVFVLDKGKGEVLKAELKATHALSELASRAPAQSTRELSSYEAMPTAIRVSFVASSLPGIPDAFPVGVYERLVADLKHSNLFTAVYRDGQTTANQAVMTLNVNIVGFKKGNERTRSIAPFWGSTELKTEMQLVDADGRVVSTEPINAAVHSYHEDLKVDDGLCKKIEKQLKRRVQSESRSGAGA